MDFKIHGEKIQYATIKLHPDEKLIGDMNNVVSMDNQLKIDMTYLHMFNKILSKPSSLWVTIENNHHRKYELIFSRRKEGVLFSIDLEDENISFKKENFLCSNMLVKDDPEFFSYSNTRGRGILILHCNSGIDTKELDQTESIELNVQSLVAISQSATIESTNKEKRKKICGPGKIWIQSIDETEIDQINCS